VFLSAQTKVQPLVLLSRLGTLVLFLLSGISFAFVYALNVKEGEDRGAIYRMVNPVIQDVSNELFASADDLDIRAPTLPPAPVPPPVTFVAEELRGDFMRRSLIIQEGDTLTGKLLAAGITRTEAAKAIEAMRAHHNPRKLMSNQRVTLLFKKNGTVETFSGFEMYKESTKLLTVSRTDEDSFKGAIKEVIPERRRFALRGVVEDSVYESGLRTGIPASVITTLIKSYSYIVDFQREVKPGDRFEVLFEQPTNDEGLPAGEPTMIYAALQVAGKITPVYRVAMPGGSFEYYDAAGRSIRKGLLRTPVEGARLTSSFGMRLHPLLGFSRMHKGVDFGAPAGAPIYAAGAGIIEEAGYRSGYGRYVRIRHNGSLSTAYAHLSKFGRAITRGTRVGQGDVIGYVGSSGIATGPHLHYEVLVNNKQANPLKVKVTTNAPLEGKQLTAFQTWRAKVHNAFEQLVAEAESGKPGVKVAQTQPSAVAQ
jgi:murein DD-endopeptidase MepM/ murein hydrolase activator NlpD